MTAEKEKELNPDQQKVLKTFVELRWTKGAKGERVSSRAGFGSDYADCLCRGLCEGGHLESEGEGKDRLYRITTKGQRALQKAEAKERGASRDFRRPPRITSWGKKGQLEEAKR